MYNNLVGDYNRDIQGPGGKETQNVDFFLS